jgi:hypothetical protein
MQQQSYLSGSLLEEGDVSSHVNSTAVLYKVIYPGGLPLRSGLELDSTIVQTVQKGTLIEVSDPTIYSSVIFLEVQSVL